LGDRMTNDDLERMWNEVVVALFTVPSRHFPGWAEEIH
jgi:hypothetical protein